MSSPSASPGLAAVRGFLAASVTVGAVSLTRLITGFVTAKYAAVALGTAGVGLYAQGTQLYLLGITVGSMAMANGVIRAISDAHRSVDSEAERYRVMATAFTIQLATSCGVLAIVLVGAGPFSRLVFGVGGSPTFLLAAAAGVPFATLASGYMGGLFFGEDRYDYYTRASCIAALGGLAAFLVMTALWGLEGALWSISVGGALIFVAYAAYAKRIVPLSRVFAFGFERRLARELVSYGAVMAVTSGASAVALLAVRAYLVRRSGAVANGLYQVPIAMTALYTPFLTNALWARLFPSVSKSGDSPESRHELNAALRLVIVGASVFVVGLLALGDVLVRVVYSDDFSPAVRLLPLQLSGDIFYFVFFTLSVYVLALRRLRAYLLGWLGYAAVLLLVSVFFVDRWGIDGAAVGYVCASLLAASVFLWMHLAAASERDRRLTFVVLVLALLPVAAEAAVVRAGASTLVRLSLPMAFLAVATTVAAHRGWRPGDLLEAGLARRRTQ